jgi:hypothetical protein
MKKFKEQEEVHMQGILTIEKSIEATGMEGDLGIQIAVDGRVWICINGEAVIRFRPYHKGGD